MRHIIAKSKVHGDQKVLVDDSDYHELSKYKWGVQKGGNTLYAITTIYSPKKTTIRMSRLILGINNPSIFCDHKDANGLNNQRTNLRTATPQQNSFNISGNGLLGQKGVSWSKLHKKFRVRITYNARVFHIGLFDELPEAAKAYNEAATKYYGEFARLNVI